MDTETLVTAETSEHTVPRRIRRPYIRLNLLTKRKHEMDNCELCDSVGSLMCANCRSTFYCGMDHYNMDKDFHSVLCSRIKELRKPIEFSTQSETRERWLKQKRIRMEELYKFTYSRGQADLEEGKYDSAIPASTVSTKYAQYLFGQAPEVIPPLLITAECYLNKGKLVVADGFVARALSIENVWTDIRPFIKARIRRNEGLIHLARNKLPEALECFSEEIYQSTEEFGPYHIRTSGGYCYLGHAFHLQKNYATSASLFRQTVQIWIDHLEPIMDEMMAQPTMPIIAGAIRTDIKASMEDCDKFEGLRLLTKCYNQQLECDSVHVTVLDLATTCQAIAAMNFVCERFAEAKGRATEGQNRLTRGNLQKHQTATKLGNIIKYCERKLYHLEKYAHSQGSETEFSVV